MSAFQIAASIVLSVVALDMLRAQRSRTQETSEEIGADAEKSDIAVTSLAVPMRAGSGAIATAIVMQSQTVGVVQQLALCVCIVGVAFANCVIFRSSARGARWLSPIATKSITRITDLLLAAVTGQFMIDGLKGVRVEWIQP